jgi:predicted DNA-binding transcriptional regulator AlpA
MQMKSGEEWLTAKQVAARLGVSQSFLAKARMRGDGPKYYRIGRAVRYLWSDVLQWLKSDK